jgi:hypothetical protein
LFKISEKVFEAENFTYFLLARVHTFFVLGFLKDFSL